MKKFKKLFAGIITGAVVTSALATCIYAADNITPSSVSRTSSDTQTYKSGSISLENFYDYGTVLPGDDAYIQAKVISGSSPYAYIYYKPYGSGSWKHKGGASHTIAYDNPSGVDYLQGGSYAESKSGTVGIKLSVVD